jgi:hypothetical protein
MQGTSGQVSFNEIGYPLNAYKTGVSGYCFLKGKICPASLKKRKYVNLFWLGAMEVSVEGISFIHRDKHYLKFWRRDSSENGILNFALLKNIIQPIRAVVCDQNLDAKLEL